MNIHTLFLIGGQDDESATFIETEIGGSCNLTCNYRGKQIKASAEDFFEALRIIRLELEGLIPFCYGASLNVFPSGMARSMATGKVAYKMQPGKHASKSDLKNIFSEGPDVIPASIAQQQEYFSDWASSERA